MSTWSGALEIPRVTYSLRNSAQGKPVAATEFGCATYHGAGNVASYIDQIIAWDDAGRASGLKGDFERDEREQAEYVRDVLDVFAAEGVDAAFVYTFARYDLPHRDNPADDLDMASAGVVKVLDGQSSVRDPRSRRYPDMPWEPKAAFDTVAEWFGQLYTE